MTTEHPHTREDKVATHVMRLGTLATIISLLVLLAVVFGNVLVLAVKVAVSAMLAMLVNQGPAVAALFGGIATVIGYYGRTRLLRRQEKFSLRDEATDQVMDQAGNALQNAPAALRSRLGCSSSLSLGIFAASLVFCCLTYLPSPLHVFGANIAAATPTLATSTPITTTDAATVALTPATTLTPTATPLNAPTATHAPVATRVPTPTLAPPQPGNLLVLPPTTVVLSNYCNQGFTGAVFSFTNNGGTTIYWTAKLPTPFSLAQGYPATGSLQPNQNDHQNEYFQGTEAGAMITLLWGYSSANEPFSATIPVTCRPIG